MPLYEYYCRSCNTTFELLRPMNRSTEPAECPSGHPEAARVVSLVAAPVRESGETMSSLPSGGGCGPCAGGSCASCGP